MLRIPHILDGKVAIWGACHPLHCRTSADQTQARVPEEEEEEEGPGA